MIVTYYIKHPNGREKIKPTPKNDEEAFHIFRNHWSAKANWASGKQRVLVKEVKEEILIEEISK